MPEKYGVGVCTGMTCAGLEWTKGDCSGIQELQTMLDRTAYVHRHRYSLIQCLPRGYSMQSYVVRSVDVLS